MARLLQEEAMRQGSQVMLPSTYQARCKERPEMSHALVVALPINDSVHQPMKAPPEFESFSFLFPFFKVLVVKKGHFTL
jgi:hypothetical protein